MLSQRTTNYAAPPPDSFWAWSNDYDAVEWYDGSTLAMWQELHGVLNFLGNEGGVPPLGAVLLLLAACRDEWLGMCIPFHEKVMAILRVTDSDAIPAEIKETLVRGLKCVNDLPKNLRSSLSAKCLLVSTLFEGGPHSLPRDQSGKILVELSIHGPRGLQGCLPEMDARTRFIRDLRALRIGLARHDAASLESLLRTGLENLSVQPVLLPKAPDDPRLLLDRLVATGGEIGAAAAVAKRAIAMMNFPGSFGTPHDLPVGGISDITNRGTVDRLLPGELAWDDLVLAARLVHNEALYFRREIPPLHVAVGHTVLLDRGLRLWGTGRVFALGMALGLRHHPALNIPGETFECVAALSEGFAHLDLATPAGVFAALEVLVPAPGPEAFLAAWLDAAVAEDDDAVPDVSFITAKKHIDEAGTRILLGQIADWIHHRAGRFRVLALGRAGDVEVQSWSPGGNRTLFHGQVDLDEILPAPQKPIKESAPPPLRAKADPLHDLLPIYALERLPFLFPQIPQGSAILIQDDSSVIGVSADRRLMHWPKTGWGGQEIVAKVPGRQHWMAQDDNRDPIIIGSGGEPGEHVRVFRYKGNKLQQIEVAASKHAFPRYATVSGGAVLLAYADSVEALSLTTGERLAVLPVKATQGDYVLEYDGERIHLNETGKKLVQPLAGWPFRNTTWPKKFLPDRIAFSRGLLTVGCTDVIYLFYPTELCWRRVTSSSETFVKFDKCSLLCGAKEGDLKIEEAVLLQAAAEELEFAKLEAGFEGWLDPRGMLHLRNPERNGSQSWSILLTTSKSAVWCKSRGLCTFEELLRIPTAPDPDDLLLRDLTTFLQAKPRP